MLLSAGQRGRLYRSFVPNSNQRYPCGNCTSVFGQKRSLLTHLRYECGQPPRFKCPYCDLISKKTSNVQKHIRRKHEGNAVYVQDIYRLPNLAVWAIIQRCSLFFFYQLRSYSSQLYLSFHDLLLWLHCDRTMLQAFGKSDKIGFFYRSLHGQNLQRILHSFVDIWIVTMQREIYVEPNTFYTILLLIFFRFRPYFFLPFFLYLSSSLVLVLFILVLRSRHNNHNSESAVERERKRERQGVTI